MICVLGGVVPPDSPEPAPKKKEKKAKPVEKKKPPVKEEPVNPAKFQEILEEQDEEDQDQFNPDDMPDVSYTIDCFIWWMNVMIDEWWWLMMIDEWMNVMIQQ